MLKQTQRGTRYLTAPECQVVASTKINPAFFSGETDGFVRALFAANNDLANIELPAQYFNDTKLADGAQLIKFAGQLCYLSFGEQRSKNAQASEYLTHIKQSGHGSVLEHYNVSVLLYGVSRAFTHELVRHRAGFGFSQVSQRYVAGKHLRFVESLATQFEPFPPEADVPYDIQTQEGRGLAQKRAIQAQLHYGFERWIDAAVCEYGRREQYLLMQAGHDWQHATTEQRKAVRQEARRCLPNETEAAIVVTGNLRAWRHFVEQRCSKWADAEACRAAHTVFIQLQALEPILWEDYVPGEPRTDGLPTLTTPYRKV